MYNYQNLSPQEVSWEPLNPKSMNFKSRKIDAPNSQTLLIKKSATMQLFTLAFFLFAVLVVGFQAGFLSNFSWDIHLVSKIMTLVSVSIPIIYLSKATFSQIELSKVNQRLKKSSLISQKEERYLGDIVALQLLTKYARRRPGDGPSGRTSSGGYVNAELNAIFKDGSRLNLNNGGSPINMKHDAMIIAEFLSVPIWEA